VKFEDLTPWDIHMIKDRGVWLLANTRLDNRYIAILSVTIDCIEAKGYDLSSKPKNLQDVFVSKYDEGSGYRSSSGSRTTFSATELISKVFDLLAEQNIELVKSQREPTWTQPRESWYIKADSQIKKPWMY
jgi:hypothetical protein